MTETTPKQTSKQIRPEQFKENDLNMIADHPDTKYYDWRDDSIRIICTSVVPNHPAYGQTFKEYMRNRNRYEDADQEKARLGFRLPPFITRVSADMAIIHGVSHYRFLTLLIELGMIYFQKDYCEQYTTIRDFRSSMYQSLTSVHNENAYMQMDKQTIEIGKFHYRSSLITPTVPLWLSNAVKDTSTYLNVSCSDFVNVLWCIGVRKSMCNENIPSRILEEVKDTINKFDSELDAATKRIEHLQNEVS